MRALFIGGAWHLQVKDVGKELPRQFLVPLPVENPHPWTGAGDAPEEEDEPTQQVYLLFWIPRYGPVFMWDQLPENRGNIVLAIIDAACRWQKPEGAER